MSVSFQPFQTGLSADDVDRNLRQSLIACDRAQAGVVLWLAEVQRRGLCRALGHPGVLQYATEALGMSRSRAYDLLQLARDLERLPRLRAAMAGGVVGWTKARLIARVATEATEERWVEAARRLGRRALAARIAEEQERARRGREERRRQHAAQIAGQADLGWSPDPRPSTVVTLPDGPPAPSPGVNPGGAVVKSADCSSPHDEQPLAPASATARVSREAIVMADPPSTLTHRLTGLELAKYEALLEQAHRRRCVSPQASREDVLLAAMSALVVSAVGDRSAADPVDAGSGMTDGMSSSSRLELAIRYQVIVYHCRACGTAAVVTNRGRRVLSPVETETVLCDARILEPGQQNRATIPPAVRAVVLARDQYRCQAPGCGRTSFLEIHHVVPRSEGGTNRPENLVTLCGRCHHFAHERPQLIRQWFTANVR